MSCNPLGQPEVDITELKDGEHAGVHRRGRHPPEPSRSRTTPASRSTVDAVEVTDEDVDKAVEQLRERFASTTAVERAAADGDVVTIDLEAKVDGEVLEDGVAKGVSYTIGSGELLDGIDEAVTGLEAGGEATFTSELKGGSAAGKEAEVTVKVDRRSPRASCPSWTTTSPSWPASSTPSRSCERTAASAWSR